MTPPQAAGIDLSIIIPCFNEGPNVGRLEATLLPVIADLSRRERVEVILVDDGSRDDTPQRLRELAMSHPEFVVVTHVQNRGLGAALRSGIAAARGEWIVTTDADGTYRFAEIPALLTRRGPAIDVITASPYHPRGGVENVPAYRLILSRGASTLYRLIVGGQVHTYTALFRAYRREVLQTVPVRSDGFLAVAQLLAESILSGFAVAEYPTVLHVRRYGQSKAKVARIMRAHLRYMAGLLIARLIAPLPRPHRKPL
jgi:dolichol-phosphate mannosyltransferase